MRKAKQNSRENAITFAFTVETIKTLTTWAFCYARCFYLSQWFLFTRFGTPEAVLNKYESDEKLKSHLLGNLRQYKKF